MNRQQDVDPRFTTALGLWKRALHVTLRVDATSLRSSALFVTPWSLILRHDSARLAALKRPTTARDWSPMVAATSLVLAAVVISGCVMGWW
ncbi:MAG: hypothetical protein JO101_08690 [Candidatus Eremiobacteraeota bacterium]|nr:hypothetical protein [Candidatus Eremiobacteraeota bacterium]MBV8355382.1 hypothetical protein [Candidatus Eremiobacteraeota bacterium]